MMPFYWKQYRRGLMTLGNVYERILLGAAKCFQQAFQLLRVIPYAMGDYVRSQATIAIGYVWFGLGLPLREECNVSCDDMMPNARTELPPPDTMVASKKNVQ